MAPGQLAEIRNHLLELQRGLVVVKAEVVTHIKNPVGDVGANHLRGADAAGEYSAAEGGIHSGVPESPGNCTVQGGDLISRQMGTKADFRFVPDFQNGMAVPPFLRDRSPGSGSMNEIGGVGGSRFSRIVSDCSGPRRRVVPDVEELQSAGAAEVANRLAVSGREAPVETSLLRFESILGQTVADGRDPDAFQETHG